MTIGWGIIGCGDVVRKRVAAAIQAHPECRLLAACRRDDAKLNAFCDDFQVAHRFQNADQLIGRKDIDAVYIATPVHLHASQAIAAMQAGKHVIVEKPMALNPSECQAMLKAAEATGRKLSVAYYRRFYPAYQRIKQLLTSGKLGDLLCINIVTSAPLPSPEDDGYWRVDLKQGGGGPLMDVGSHRIDLLIDLLGMPTNVQAITSKVAASYESENIAGLTLQFGTGAQVSLQCLFGAASDPDQWTMIGTQAIVEATPLNAGKLRILTGNSVNEEEHPPHDNFNVPLISDFVEAITSDRNPLIDGQSGMAVNAVMDEAYAVSRAKTDSLGKG